MHALALREPVAADLGEGAADEDRLLIPQHRSPEQTQQLGAAQAAERGGEDGGGVVEILLSAAGQLLGGKRPLGNVHRAAGLRGARVGALAGVVNAGAGRADERPDLLDAVDLEVAGVLDLGALEAVDRVDVDPEASPRDLEDARQHGAALVERAAGETALGQLVAVVLEFVGVDVDCTPVLPAGLELTGYLGVGAQRRRRAPLLAAALDEGVGAALEADPLERCPVGLLIEERLQRAARGVFVERALRRSAATGKPALGVFGIALDPCAAEAGL